MTSGSVLQEFGETVCHLHWYYRYGSFQSCKFSVIVGNTCQTSHFLYKHLLWYMQLKSATI